MSEYRETTTIEEVTLPEPEPVVTLAELVSKIDWNVGSTNIARSAEQSPLKTAEVIQLLQSDVITIPKNEVTVVERRLRNLSDSGSVRDFLQYGRELATNRQERLLESSLGILREACFKTGFTEVKLYPKEGILVALESGTTHRAVIEIEKAARGQVAVNFDMDGFHGGACIDRADAMVENASDLGFQLNLTDRRRKTDGPVGGRQQLQKRKRVQQG